MRLIRILSLSLFLTGVLGVSSVYGRRPASQKHFGDNPPAKSVFIKHPMADDVNAFFSGNRTFMFEIYKVGDKADMDKILKSFLKDKDVESCTAGNVTGDYSAVNLVLKSNKNKAWFIAQFKKAGLNNIKINRNALVVVDKL